MLIIVYLDVFKALEFNEQVSLHDHLLLECAPCLFVMDCVLWLQREAKSFDRGAIFFASLLWRKLTIPMVRRWSNSSDGNGTAFLFPAVLATISGECLVTHFGAAICKFITYRGVFQVKISTPGR